jgi:hypothetical protein
MVGIMESLEWSPLDPVETLRQDLRTELAAVDRSLSELTAVRDQLVSNLRRLAELYPEVEATMAADNQDN